MRTLVPALALGALASACHCGASRPVWVGLRGEARILAASAGGSSVATVAAPPSIAAPVRGLLARADGSVLVLEDVDQGAAPALLVGRSGVRLATFAAADGSGAPLFDADDPPWAAASAPDGTIWVTGGLAPVLYRPDGSFLARADPAANPTRGIAALPDGRMLVAHGPVEVAIYRADGTLASSFAASLGPLETYYGIDALAVGRDGAILVGVLRHGIATEGVVIEASLGEGTLVPVRDPSASARLAWAPSALLLDGDEVLAGPALGTLAPASCAVRLSPDLSAVRGCVTLGMHRGVAVVR